jgi:hypothetical protein
MLLWNELTYELQMQVLDKFEDLLQKETDNDVRLAIAAGITELEIWSNTPCKIIEDFEGFSNDHVAEATDPGDEE